MIISAALLMESARRAQEFIMSLPDTALETHFSIADLAKKWRLSRETVRLLLLDEPGVLRVRLGRKKKLTRYSVPESVARRIHTRLSATTVYAKAA